MMQIKGNGESMAAKHMNQALGGKKASDAPERDARFARGYVHEPKEAPQPARSLGTNNLREDQLRRQQQGGARTDWTSSSNRINLGPAPMIQSKTNVDRDYEDRGYQEEVRNPVGDALTNGKLDRSAATKMAALSDDEDDPDFGEEADSAVAQWRAARMEELKKSTARTQAFQALGHGSYVEIVQDDFLKEVTKSKYCVVHFYHPEFERCKIIDKHLEGLARKHLATKWLKLDANKAPFFVGKLQIKMLPTLVFFKDGIARDRMVGLEDVGAKDDFTTSELEARIAKAGVIITGDKISEDELEARNRTAHSIRQSTHQRSKGDSSEDDE